jgi:group I intron endonuclease
MAVSGIYRILNIVSGKAYIGSAANVKARLNWHKCYLRKGKHPNIKLQRTWAKHGEDAFLFELIEEVEVPSLNIREQHYMDTYSAASIGYNIAPNAEGNRGRTLTPEHRAKIGASSRGKPRSPETRARISAAQKGKKLSPEHIEKLREWFKRRKMTPEHIAALTRGRVIAVTGKSLSPEHRAKISSAHIGMTLSAETRAKISSTKRGM